MKERAVEKHKGGGSEKPLMKAGSGEEISGKVRYEKPDISVYCEDEKDFWCD